MTVIKPSRRDILRLAALAPAFALPAMARAQIGTPGAANPAHFRFTHGDARITILSDGYFTISSNGLAVNAPRDEVHRFLESHYLSPQEAYSHTNHLFVEMGDAKVLVDVGSGSRFLSGTGQLLTNMEAAGIDPSEVTHVVITHAHPDHIWGIRDDFDEALFPDAQYFIGADEHGYWMQDDFVNKVAAEDQQFVLGAVNSINCDGVDWTLLNDGDEIIPGLRAIASPGHTPGHMCVVLESQGKQLMALGDSLSHAYTNFEHPNWFNSSDMDGDQTVATRKRLLDMAAADRITVLGYHFPFPGVGHVLPKGDSFQFLPALWQFPKG